MSCTNIFVDYKGWQVCNIANVPDRIADFESNFQSREEDVWICAYPKCGTHWVNEIICMLCSGSLERGLPKEKFFAEMTLHREWESLESPRILNTHLPPAFLPEGVLKSKVVFMLRNFKDVYVSLYHHYLALHAGDEPKTWNQFFDSISSSLEIFRYHHAWVTVANENPNNILVINYEGIKEDPIASIAIIAKFLDKENSESSTFYKEIANATGFSVMQSLRKDDSVHIDDTGIKVPVGRLYRKGIVGDWRNWFTKDQNDVFDKHYREEVGQLSLGIEKYMDLE